MRRLCFCIVLLALSFSAAADIELREARLAAQLRCVVCQNQTIAESNAPLAVDMRREIRAQLQAGRSDKEVLAFFEQRYGSFVSYTPPFKPSTWLLWGAPFGLGVAGIVGLAAAFRRRANLGGVEVLDAAQRERARQLLQDDSTS